MQIYKLKSPFTMFNIQEENVLQAVATISTLNWYVNSKKGRATFVKKAIIINFGLYN